MSILNGWVSEDMLIIFCYLGSVALIVQIHLQQNRSDLALKEVQAAKRWAQDSLLVNLAESWVGLRVVRPFFFWTILYYDQNFADGFYL